jgi:cytochrome c-type biogenesis protein CcsB
MRLPLAGLLALWTLSVTALAEAPAEPGLDWKVWRSMPVQDGGRHKPLDSLAWETFRLIGNRTSFTDPETQQKLDATALYLSMLFDWQEEERAGASGHAAGAHGAGAAEGCLAGMGAAEGCIASPMGGMNSSTACFKLHEPDKWDRMPLILVDSLELREALGMAADQKHISALELSEAEIQDPRTQSKIRFVAFAQRAVCRQGQGITTFEKKAIGLVDRLRAYQEHRTGWKLEVVPLPDGEDRQWASIASLMRLKLDDRLDPSGGLRQVKEQFQKAKAAYRTRSPDAFQEASAAFLATLREVGPRLGDYPRRSTIDLEVAYNHWVPFRFAWVLTLLACLGVLLSMGTGSKIFYAASIGSFTAGLVAMLIGFGLRVAISGRAPVTNMYESVIYVGLGVTVLGLIFELVYRRRFVLAAAAAVSTITLVLADNCPAILDPNLQPLNPILRNNFWLVIHVLTITLSYAAFALALGIGNITLGYYLKGSKDRDAVAALGKFTYRTLQIGVVLLAAGTVTGGIWADYSWGRFWGWDPKEVWALIALLGYVAVLHARYVGWVGSRGLAALSVICFSLVVVAWYGVNFIMGTGLHSYGFGGGGGQIYVAAALTVQFLYVGLALLRSAGRPAPPLSGSSRPPAARLPLEVGA